MMVPIKYLYERRGYGRSGISSVTHDEEEWFNVQKTRSRYYCCKNRIAYYEWRDKEMKDKTEQKKIRFISYHGWTEDGD